MAANGRMPDFISVNEADDGPDLFVPRNTQRSPFSANGMISSNGHSNIEDTLMTDDLSRLIQQASRQGGWSESTPDPRSSSSTTATVGQQQDQNVQRRQLSGQNGSHQLPGIGLANHGVPMGQPKAQAQVQAQQPQQPQQAPQAPQAQQASQSAPNDPALKAQFVLFGAAEDDLAYIIPKKSLQNLPGPVLQKLATKGNLVGPSVYMTNYAQLESMVRLKDYLESKNYRPFIPPTSLEYSTEDGKTVTWQVPKKPLEALKTVRITNETRDLFYREIELYLFAAELAYDELRRLSLTHIMNRYPKSIETLWTMIQQLYGVVHPEDRVLRQHIVELITVNREELTSHESFSSYMRKFVKIEGALGETLFDAYTKALADIKRKINEGGIIRKASTVGIKSEPPEQRDTVLTPIKRSASIATSETPRYKSDEGWPSHHIRPSDLPKIAEAFLQQRLVVAKKSGYGTLVRPDAPRTRNRDFQFSAGELLLVKSSEVDTSRNAHNIVIYNSAGEKGDVLAELVCDFPDDLGVRLRAGPIEWGQLYQIPRLNPSSSNGFPDREERLNKSERRRSTSPRGRLSRH